MDRARFFAAIKKPLFGGRFTQKQVEGIDAILDEAERRATPIAWLAYILTTSHWETGRKMQPVREIGRGKGKAYGKPAGPHGLIYYGRGDVQLTWYDNYVKLGRALGIDLAANPDLALENRISKAILFTGMEEGLFAGDRKGRHTLARHLPLDGIGDWVTARRIVNGTDRAVDIAKNASKFGNALAQAGYGDKPAEKPAGGDKPSPATPLPDDPGTAAQPPLLPPDAPDEPDGEDFYRGSEPITAIRLRWIVAFIIVAALAALIWRAFA